MKQVRDISTPQLDVVINYYASFIVPFYVGIYWLQISYLRNKYFVSFVSRTSNFFKKYKHQSVIQVSSVIMLHNISFPDNL